MRIASAGILIAVLSLTAVVRASPRLESAESSLRHSRHAAHRQQESWQEDWTPHRMQALLRREGGEEGRPVDCCPSVMQMVQPKGGRNQEGRYVELYVGNNPNNETQRFYEFSCREDVLDLPCRFVERKMRNQSRCEQKYSYQYAIVRADDPSGSPPSPGHTFFPNGTSGWKLDYISVRSGCSCVIKPTRKNKNQGHPRKNKQGSKYKRHPLEPPPRLAVGVAMGPLLDEDDNT